MVYNLTNFDLNIKKINKILFYVFIFIKIQKLKNYFIFIYKYLFFSKIKSLFKKGKNIILYLT